MEFQTGNRDEQGRSIGTVEAARVLGVGRTTVQRWIDSGEIPSHKTLGGHRRVNLDDLIGLARRMKKDVVSLRPRLSRSLLIVDDEPDVIEALEDFLRGVRPDLAVHSATTGFEAGILVHKHLPAAVLLDIRMPHVNGVRVCRFIKSAEETAAIKVFAITSSRDASEHKAMLDAGAEKIIKKPFERNQLKLILSSVYPLEQKETATIAV